MTLNTQHLSAMQQEEPSAFYHKGLLRLILMIIPAENFDATTYCNTQEAQKDDYTNP